MGIIGGVGYGGYAYYIDSQERMATLRTNNAKLLVANETKDATIATMLASQNQAQELNKALSKDTYYIPLFVSYFILFKYYFC